MTARTPYTVLMIGGAGRSGSTLLELMLDQIPGVIAVGELTDLWDAALRRDERCGCGRSFAECPFWSEVGERAFGGWKQVDAERLLAEHDDLARNRQLPWLLAGPVPRSFRSRVDEYAAILARIYAAVARISSARVIVDASKWPSHAMVLRRAPGLDLRLVHLVRDPRGVAHSWARALERPQAVGADGEVDWREMRRDHPAVAAVHWMALNIGTELVRALGVPTSFVRYEDLVAEPRVTLAAILAHAGQRFEPSALEFIGQGSVRLAPGHGVAGNPSRFRHGEVRLRSGEEWRAEMPRGERRLVGAITLPLEFAYRRRTAGAPLSIVE